VLNSCSIWSPTQLNTTPPLPAATGFLCHGCIFLYCTTRERPGRDGSITKKDEDLGEETASITMRVLPPPPLWFQGGNTLALAGEGVGEPIRTKGRLSGTLVIV
jgi:hypothetical protein